MQSDPIQDVQIGGRIRRRRGNGIKTAIFLLFILLIAVCVAYWYFLFYKVEQPAKEAFLTHMSNSNIKYLANNELYKEIINKYNTKSFESTTSMSFSSTVSSNENLTNIDISKLTIDLNNIKDITNLKTYDEIGIKYSNNDLLKIGKITTENTALVTSEDVLTKYIGVHEGNINNDIKEIMGKNEFAITYEDILNNYISINKESLNNIMNHIYGIAVNGNIEKEKIKKIYNDFFANIPEEKFTKQGNIVLEGIDVTAYTLKLNQLELNSALKNLQETIREDTEIISSLAVLLHQETSTTLETIEQIIGECIKGDETSDETALSITVYASEKATEKITIELSDKTKLDLEFDSKSERENTVKITYLRDQIVVATSGGETAIERNGFSIEIYKKSDASTTLRVVFSDIQKEKIVQKTTFDLITTGTENSKKYINKLIISLLNNKGETKITLNNSISFDTTSRIENVNEEDCLFLDTLSEEELEAEIQAIKDRINEVYTEKLEEISFLDTNNRTSVVEQQTVPREEEPDREALKQILIQGVSIKMGEAINNDLQYTIQDIESLEIEGHTVSATMGEDYVMVNIDGCKFRIDSNFILTDVE